MAVPGGRIEKCLSLGFNKVPVIISLSTGLRGGAATEGGDVQLSNLKTLSPEGKVKVKRKRKACRPWWTFFGENKKYARNTPADAGLRRGNMSAS